MTYTPDDVQETGTLVLRSSNVKNGEIVDADNVYVSDKVATSENVQKGDIIVVVRNGSRALIGKHAQIKASMPNTVIGAFMSGIRSEHSSFVNALLDTSAFDNEIAKNMGATINQITGYMFSKMEFMIPSEEEQQRLGEYFSNLDNLITLHQRKLEQTKTLKKYMLQKMFPQEGQKVPEIRFEGFTGDWEQRKFREIVEKYEDPIETPTEGYTRLGIRSHAKGTFHSYVEKGKELETAKMFRVAADKFIVNITFSWEHAVAITDENDAGKLVSHRFPQYSFNTGMNPKFFRYLILDENFKHHLELSSPGGAGRNRVLKLSDMLQYKMNFPSEAEQKKIAAYFDDLDNLITLHQRRHFCMKYTSKCMINITKIVKETSICQN